MLLDRLKRKIIYWFIIITWKFVTSEIFIFWRLLWFSHFGTLKLLIIKKTNESSCISSQCEPPVTTLKCHFTGWYRVAPKKAWRAKPAKIKMVPLNPYSRKRYSTTIGRIIWPIPVPVTERPTALPFLLLK